MCYCMYKYMCLYIAYRLIPGDDVCIHLHVFISAYIYTCVCTYTLYVVVQIIHVQGHSYIIFADGKQCSVLPATRSQLPLSLHLLPLPHFLTRSPPHRVPTGHRLTHTGSRWAHQESSDRHSSLSSRDTASRPTGGEEDRQRWMLWGSWCLHPARHSAG